MKYNITSQGPTSLNCPKCGNLCNFSAGQEVIVCSKCRSELQTDNLTKNIDNYLILQFIVIFLLSYFMHLNTVLESILLIASVILMFTAPKYVYKKSYLVEIRKNT